MSKLSLVTRNQKREKMRDKYKNRRAKWKKVIYDKTTSLEEKFQAQLELQKIPRNASPVRVRLRCELTGRGRGNYRKFKMARHKFRQLASSGKIPGVTKASW
ncbi:MAG: 30S ribosomal protein S14 [Hydrotalea sp.]|nr:30S ribosomal protein S14 [Hydrotalea sp.]